MFARISRVRLLRICPKSHRLLAIQLCEKFEESGTFESRDMGLCDPKIDPLDRVSCVCKDISCLAA